MMADPMLAPSAVDRIVNSAYELVLEGESYRSRQKPARHASSATPLASRRRGAPTPVPGDPRTEDGQGPSPAVSSSEAAGSK
jgi:hypothetical protein